MRTAVSYSLDLLAVALAALGAFAAVTATSGGPWLLAPVAVLLTFLPGYALVAALWPRASDLRPALRGALALVLSVGLVPLVAFALDPFVGFRPVLVAAIATGGTVVACVVAVVRRAGVDDPPRPLGWLAVSAGRYFRRSSDLRRPVPLGARSGKDVAMNVLIVASVLVLAATVGVAAVVPQTHGYTEAYLTDGAGANASVVSNGGGDVSAATLDSLHAVVENHEDHAATYRTVVAEQRVTRRNGATHVESERVLDRATQRVAAGESWTQSVPSGGGGNRLVVRVYRDDAQQPTATLTLRR